MANVIDLEKLENLVTTSTGWQARCPACSENNEDSHGKNHLGVQRDGKFNCLKYSGDKIHLARILQLVGTESDGTAEVYVAPPPKIDVEKSWPVTILDKLIQDFSYFEKRGISAETQRRFRLGVALSGSLNGRVCVPIFDERKSKIIGFNARLINYSKWHKDNGIGKWKIVGNKKSFVLCGDEKTIPNNSILITEGPADVLALYEAGIKNTLCLFGTTISSKQLAFLIKNNPKKIVIGLNNEPNNKNIGFEAAKKLEKVLLNYFGEEKVVIGLPPMKDFNDCLEKDKKILDEYREKWLS